MLTLMLASRIHSRPAAIQSDEDVGMMNSAMLEQDGAARKYGRRRPSRPHVRSLSVPTIGCTSRPVTVPPARGSGCDRARAPSVS